MDAVVTWVDGSDPAHRAKRLQYLPDGQDGGAGAAETRFASCDEIFYCIASILRFAPEFQRIFVVTDAQVPPIADRLEAVFPGAMGRLRIVDHTEIFRGFEELLPTFNSISITAMSHRIEGLSEHYVLFNDDVVLLRSAERCDFFVGDDPVLRGQWATLPTERIERWLKALEYPRGRIGFKGAQRRAARLSGARSRYFLHDHTPHPFRRSTLEAHYAAHPEQLQRNSSFRFRDHSQFGNAALAYHLEIGRGNQNFASTDLVYLRPVKSSGDLNYVRRKLGECESPNSRFACFQSLDRLGPEGRDSITDWLSARLRLPGTGG